MYFLFCNISEHIRTKIYYIIYKDCYPYLYLLQKHLFFCLFVCLLTH